MASQDSVTIPIHKPRVQEKLFFLISGMIVSIPLTLFVYTFSDYLLSFTSTVYASVLSTVLLAPFVEEFSKAYPLFYRHAETERSIFTLGFLVGLGFGIVELIEYVVLLQEPVLIRLPAVLFHASATSITAFGIAKKRTLPFYLVAVALHLLNNLFAVLGPVWDLTGPAVLGAAYLLSWFLYGKTQEHMIPL
ncbi:MAG: PrsW family glutamic-type intramembrane protease [Candidatus Bathyarchaeia archaeon]